MTVQEVSMLQVIRMKDSAKNAAEIAKYLNRTDSANVLYALRKLEKLGLIEKSPGPPRETTYQVTEQGREITDRYAAKRRDLLLSLIDRMSQSGSLFEGVNRTLWLMSGLYEQVARTVSVMSYLSDDTGQPTVLKLDEKARKTARAPRGQADAAPRTRKAAG